MAALGYATYNLLFSFIHVLAVNNPPELVGMESEPIDAAMVMGLMMYGMANGRQMGMRMMGKLIY